MKDFKKYLLQIELSYPHFFIFQVKLSDLQIVNVQIWAAFSKKPKYRFFIYHPLDIFQ